MELIDYLVCTLVFIGIYTMWKDSKESEEEVLPPWIQDPWGGGRD